MKSVEVMILAVGYSRKKERGTLASIPMLTVSPGSEAA